MKPFDWIILIIFVPWWLLWFLARANALNHPLVKAGAAKPHIKSWEVWMLFFIVLAECYKVWG